MTIMTGIKATAIVAGKKTANDARRVKNATRRGTQKITKPFKSIGEGISESASRFSEEIKAENDHQKRLRHNRQIAKAETSDAILTTAEEES